MDISRPCQPEKLIPLLPWPGFDPSFSGHNDRRAITASGHDYALDRSAIGAGTPLCHVYYHDYSCNQYYYQLPWLKEINHHALYSRLLIS